MGQRLRRAEITAGRPRTLCWRNRCRISSCELALPIARVLTARVRPAVLRRAIRPSPAEAVRLPFRFNMSSSGIAEATALHQSTLKPWTKMRMSRSASERSARYRLVVEDQVACDQTGRKHRQRAYRTAARNAAAIGPLPRRLRPATVLNRPEHDANDKNPNEEPAHSQPARSASGSCGPRAAKPSPASDTPPRRGATRSRRVDHVRPTRTLLNDSVTTVAPA